MRLKSFYGPTMTDAMKLVRESLGEDAIIVATRDDEERGGVRVTAAVDEPTISEHPSTESFSSGSDAIDLISSALIRHQLPASLAEKLVASATQLAGEDSSLALGAAFDVHFSFVPLEDAPARPLIMIGPPGAGKTLTTAKLAAKAALAKKRIALIGADTERAGSREQLAAFARTFKTEIMEIEDPQALEDAVSIQQPGTSVFIDTAGCNPFNASERAQLATLLKYAKADIVLVLPADLDQDVICEMARYFVDLGAKRIIATRLDMTRRLGGLLRASFETKLPLSLFSASASVAQKLSPFNPVSLARLVLPPSAQDASREAV